ncbi:hypothetical protein ACFHWD_03125 [Clostridium sp. MT-14]|uniref:hypothetical protein n=1 Tax=Clostridium sp. MT-14 TaxID=3348360 RepID=UPI0035F21E59
MNKKILKKRKEIKLNNKKSFSKQSLLFMKKYPHLFPICNSYGISKKKIDRIFKIMHNITLKSAINNINLELAIRMILVAIKMNHKFKEGSIGKFYYDLFKKEGIKI